MKAPTNGQARDLLRILNADAVIVFAFAGGKAARCEVAFATNDPVGIDPTRALAAKMMDAIGGMVAQKSAGSA